MFLTEIFNIVIGAYKKMNPSVFWALNNSNLDP